VVGLLVEELFLLKTMEVDSRVRFQVVILLVVLRLVYILVEVDIFLLPMDLHLVVHVVLKLIVTVLVMVKVVLCIWHEAHIQLKVILCINAGCLESKAQVMEEISMLGRVLLPRLSRRIVLLQMEMMVALFIGMGLMGYHNIVFILHQKVQVVCGKPRP
jgi:hypothetical protein